MPVYYFSNTAKGHVHVTIFNSWNREHIKQGLGSYLVYCLMITVLLSQNLLFGCACLHLEEYFQVSDL